MDRGTVRLHSSLYVLNFAGMADNPFILKPMQYSWVERCSFSKSWLDREEKCRAFLTPISRRLKIMRSGLCWGIRQRSGSLGRNHQSSFWSDWRLHADVDHREDGDEVESKSRYVLILFSIEALTQLRQIKGVACAWQLWGYLWQGGVWRGEGRKGGAGGKGHMEEMGTMWLLLLRERLPSIPLQVTILMLTTFSSGVFKQDCCPIWATEPW